MFRFINVRRLALLGVLLGTQFLTACCLPPLWHGGPRGGGRYSDGGGRYGQPAPQQPPMRQPH